MSKTREIYINKNKKNADLPGLGSQIQNSQIGFTLIELSIVLIIIGLIIGGVLVGQDLIRAAEIRATVGQIEKYNAAVNTFHGKYTGLPGDLDVVHTAAFNFYTAAGSAGRGDGDGLIDGIVAGTIGQYSWTQEGGIFWVHLSQANLLDAAFSTAWDNTSPLDVIAASVPTTWPPARLARGNYINVGSANGVNYWMISGISSAAAAGTITVTANLTPIELYNMDVKLDDGNPLTGIVQAHATAGTATTTFTDPPSSNSTSTIGTCLLGDTVGTATTDTYNRNLTAGGVVPACMGRFQFN